MPFGVFQRLHKSASPENNGSSQSQAAHGQHPSAFAIPVSLLSRTRTILASSSSARGATTPEREREDSPRSSIQELESRPLSRVTTTTSPTRSGRAADTTEGLIVRALASGQAYDRAASPSRTSTPIEEQEDNPDNYTLGQEYMTDSEYAQYRAAEDSGQLDAMVDRFTQRNLARLETERSFRETRSHSGGAQSPATNHTIINGFNTNTQEYSPDHSQYRLHHSRSFHIADDTTTPLTAPKPTRSNRQSMVNGSTGGSPGSQSQSSQSLQAHPPLPTHTERESSRGNVGRVTPQPQIMDDDVSNDQLAQLVKDHRELKDKYTKVKKYYFDKEDQVKQLQNSLAHQRLAQSRTSLDDSEYVTRFNRLDGLIAQLAFSIRKSWKTIPSWLATSVNKDAINTGKQEMTAAGRAFISCWLVEEVFDKQFHPDLEATFSANLKMISKNIRKYNPPCQTNEEEEYLTAKVVNWRLSTLDGLQEALRAPQAAANRAQLMEMLKEHLIGALHVHLENPPMSDLEGGVHMIIELAVSMATHLPMESRDVQIEYYMPGTLMNPEIMKQEGGIPALGTSVQDDAAERMSHHSTNSDMGGTSPLEQQSQSISAVADNPPPASSWKRDVLSVFTGSKKNPGAQGKHAAAGASTASLGQPDSVSGGRDDLPPRVRMAVGIGAQVRGKTVLVKAPIFTS
ncbi:hypothetical protein MBLNU457_g0154t1 [Dothideomycetes sp. NU457]